MLKFFILSFLMLGYGASECSEINRVAYQKPSEELVLYINPRCPYCKKVTDYLASSGRTITIKNTQDIRVREELINIGGKPQVPCLVIRGKALYESDEIIKWLKEHR